MAEIIKETVTTTGKTKNTNPASREATSSQTAEYVIYYLLGALEVLLAFRLIFKLAGASMSSGFVKFVYGLTGLFVMPFEGIFRKAYSQGVETASILEPSTIVAILVYAVLAWGLVKLVAILSGEEQQS